jgi:type I restriction enzyme S subunit
MRKDHLQDLTQDGIDGIINAGRITRLWVDDDLHGHPFLSSTDILQADLSNISHIAKSAARQNSQLLIKDRWTLITRSGTIGRMTYARTEMRGMACSEDVLRVVPDEAKVLPGYIYAYLSSQFGVPLIVSGTYGSIITHLEPSHIAKLLVPRLGQIENQAHELIQQAANLRTDASIRLKRATGSLTEHLGKPTLRETYSSAQVVSSSEIGKTMRMEGYFYNQKARDADRWASTHSNGVWNLSDIADVYDVPQFKHIYVETEYGLPFFTSGDLFKLERKPEKHLSSTQTKDLDKYILGRNWVLLARSGQLGGIICRPQFSDSAMEGTATSDHVIRIIAKSDDVPPGYIYAYLSTPEIGYPLLMRTSCGTSIPALWPTYLKSLPIVRAPLTFMNMVDAEVKGAFEMRVEATRLEDEARALVELAIEEGGR